MAEAIGYLYDPELHEAANASGANHWTIYLEEVLRQLGGSSVAVAPGTGRGVASQLKDLHVLIVTGPLPRRGKWAEPLAAWVESGGTLLGLAAEGLDPLFGNAFHSMTPPFGSPFEPTALLRFEPHPLTTGIYQPHFDGQPVPLFGALRKARCQTSEPLAHLLSMQHAPTGFAAATHRRVGSGQAVYFGFDLAQTMWVLHKGRPIEGDYDLDGYWRLSDAVVIGSLPQDVPYADELLFLLQNVVHQAGIPMIHPVPPVRGEPADLLLYFGGDDEALADGSQVLASDFMKSRGLPYHINVMPNAAGEFPLAVEEHDHLVANGHETALHYNFIDGFEHPGGFRRRDVQRQWDLFTSRFGAKSITTVMHCVRWCGWAEPARWMRAAGGRADNSRIGVTSPPMNPTNTLGFSFGTAFPHYYYDDARRGNRRIDFLAEPIVAYEVGYDGASTDLPVLHRALDLAAHYHLTMDFFYHPYNFAHAPGCTKAVDEIKRYLKQRSLRPAYFGCDELWRWWDARSRSGIDCLETEGSQTRFLARCAHRDGMVVRVPARSSSASVTVDGQSTPMEIEEHCGLPYVLTVCPSGESEVQVTFEEDARPTAKRPHCG